MFSGSCTASCTYNSACVICGLGHCVAALCPSISNYVTTMSSRRAYGFDPKGNLQFVPQQCAIYIYIFVCYIEKLTDDGTYNCFVQICWPFQILSVLYIYFQSVLQTSFAINCVFLNVHKILTSRVVLEQSNENLQIRTNLIQAKKYTRKSIFFSRVVLSKLFFIFFFLQQKDFDSVAIRQALVPC